MKNRMAILIMFILSMFLLKTFYSPSPDIVGPEHFHRVQPLLYDILEQAQYIPIKTNQKIQTRIKKGKGIRGRSSLNTRIIRDDQNRFFVVFDMGGGLLGHQGYIYSKDPNVLISNVSGIPIEESHIIRKIRDHWWSYDSTED